MEYQKLGLKSGLEIHQHLDSHKLFCSCPSEIRQDKPNIMVRRELRPLVGETGKIDPAALFEKKKRKFYIYEAYSDTTCLVELDEEPPHPVNQDALSAALLIAKMLHCEILDVAQVMRKTVVDGSDPSGFQRTMLIGMNGYIDTSFGKVGITNVILEEDAGRRIEEDKDSVTFRLDRMGIPEIEIGTAPDIKTPEQGKELAEKIGMLLRSTGKVRRGIGTIRQDVNVSITGGTRVEIKLVQELEQIPKLIEKEAERQLEIIRAGKKVPPEVRNALPDGSTKFLRPMPGAARMYPETDIPLVKIDKERLARMKIPESFEDKEKKFIKLGLSEDLAKQIVHDVRFSFIESLFSKFKNVKPSVIASAIFSIESEVKRKTGKEVKFTNEQYDEVLNLLDKGKIAKEALLDVFVDLSKGERLDDITKKFAKLSDTELKKEIEKLKAQFKDIPKEKLQGVIMGKLRGKADPKKIIELLK